MKRVEIDKERRDALLAAIKAHFLDKHDEEIGETQGRVARRSPRFACG
jgi:hypothetical protein